MQILIKLSITLAMVFTMCSMPVLAKEETDGAFSSEITFQEKVENTQYFKQFEDRIVAFVSANVIDLDGETANTIVYEMEASEGVNKYLVFVADENYKFKEIVISEASKEFIRVEDLLTKNIAILSNASTDCRSFICTEEESYFDVNYDRACAVTVGIACSGLTLIPYYGLIAFILCKGGVVVACTGMDYGKRCIDGFWDNVCEM